MNVIRFGIIATLALNGCVPGYFFDWPGPNGSDAGDAGFADVHNDMAAMDVVRDGQIDATGDAVVDAQPDVVDVVLSDVLAPRLIAPLSTSTVTSHIPTLRWEPAVGSSGASVQICRDLAFTSMCQTIVTANSSAPIPLPLNPGVWFWRARSIMGAAVGRQFSPTWEFIVGGNTSSIDTSWGTTLDVNRDGFADVAVGARSSNTAYVFLGSATGLSMTATATFLGTGTASTFGGPVVSAGDINGDGFGDVVVDASGENSGMGNVYFYFGNANGISSIPAGHVSGTEMNEGFGESLAGVGDVNRDGYADVIVGSNRSNTQTGIVSVYYGTVDGLSLSHAQVLHGSTSMAHFGWSVGAAGDLNGDGYDDIVVGEVNPFVTALSVGKAYVYFGGSGFFSPSPNVTLNPNNSTRVFGISATCAGDVNGDGYADLLIGGSTVASTGNNLVQVFNGGILLAPTAAATLTATQTDTGFAAASDSGGDVDGDGYSDILVTAVNNSNTVANVFVFTGSTTGVISSRFSMIPGRDQAGGFGTAIAGTGDVNGDGSADIIVGAPYGGGSTRPGAAYFYLGGTSPSAIPAGMLMGAANNAGFATNLASLLFSNTRRNAYYVRL